MSAVALREAAKVLRERAQVATPGPWEHMGGDSGHSRYELDCSVITSDIGDTVVSMDALTRLGNERHGRDDGRHDAAYIATMHPDVGLALADWLDADADLSDDMDMPCEDEAVRIADLILGSQS